MIAASSVYYSHAHRAASQAIALGYKELELRIYVIPTIESEGQERGCRMPGFGIGNVNAGEEIEHLVRTLTEVQGNPNILARIEDAGQTCLRWGGVIGDLLKEESIHLRYQRNGPPGEKSVRPFEFDLMREELRSGKAIIIEIKLPQTSHMFTIEPQRGNKARVLHAWEGEHTLRVQKSMPIDDMVNILKRLPTYDSTQQGDIRQLRNDCTRLWGESHAADIDTVGPNASRRKISYTTIFTGEPKRPLSECGESFLSLSSESTEWHSVCSDLEEGSAAHQYGRGAVRIRTATGIGAGLGLVLGAAGVLILDHNADWRSVVKGGIKAGIAMGIGEGAGAAVAKAVRPTFPGAGVSIVRANAVSGTAMFAVFALWDIAEWSKHDITAVELRKRLTAGAAGALGGIGGGIAVGAAGGAWLGPPGAFVGGLIGGIAGGVGGAYVGAAIDESIWDEGEDSIMNSYEFFGWHSVKRETRPVKTPREIAEAYCKKLKEKPPKMSNEDWATSCTATLMVLLRTMFPVFIKLQEIAENLRKKNTRGVSVIGTAMYQSLPEHYGQI